MLYGNELGDEVHTTVMMSHIVSFFCRTNRLCVETTTIGDIMFPKGVQIMIPIYELHHDSKYWEEPEKFNPDR